MKILYNLLLLFNVSVLINMSFLSTALAKTTMSFYTSNQNPLITVYGLPPIETAEFPSIGKTFISISSSLTNSSILSENNNEYLLLDGENFTTTFKLRWGFRDKIYAGIDIPYTKLSGGYADGFIRRWHDVLHIPNKKRRLAYSADYKFKYIYQKNGRVIIDNNQSQQGLGDIRLSSGIKLRQIPSKNQLLTLRLGIELPTGDSSKLLGSDSSDIHVYLSGQHRFFSNASLIVYGGLGGLYSTPGEILKKEKKDYVGFASLGVSWLLYSQFSIKLQSDMHTAFYKSDLKHLSEPSNQVSIGCQIVFNKSYSMDFAVVENISYDSIPDLTLYGTLTGYY